MIRERRDRPQNNRFDILSSLHEFDLTPDQYQMNYNNIGDKIRFFKIVLLRLLISLVPKAILVTKSKNIWEKKEFSYSNEKKKKKKKKKQLKESY